jgi:hypothetical protein
MSARPYGLGRGWVMAMYLLIQLCSNIASNADERLIARPQNHRICVVLGVERVEAPKSVSGLLSFKLAAKASTCKICSRRATEASGALDKVAIKAGARNAAIAAETRPLYDCPVNIQVKGLQKKDCNARVQLDHVCARSSCQPTPCRTPPSFCCTR